MDHDQLEDWAHRVMQELQDFCDEAQAAEGKPLDEDCLPGTRALMEEFEQIKKGLPTWQAKVSAEDEDDYLDIPAFLRRSSV